MGKNKNRDNNNNNTEGQNQNQNQNNQNQNQNHQNQDQNNQNQNQNHQNKNQEENNKEKTPPADGNSKESETKNNKQQNTGAIVLGVYLHCQGCVEQVVKSLRGFEGVEEVEPNTVTNRVTVKGKSADPMRVAERVRRKTGKHVDLISPIAKKQPEKKVEKKPETPKVIETVLKMHLHCEGCAKDVKHCIHKMHGVQTVNADMTKSQVTVTGTFDPKDLVTYVIKRAGKHAEVVNAKNKQNKNEGQGAQAQKQDQEKKETPKDGKNTGFSYPNVPPGLIYAPQLFSDENPNACFIM